MLLGEHKITLWKSISLQKVKRNRSITEGRLSLHKQFTEIPAGEEVTIEGKMTDEGRQQIGWKGESYWAWAEDLKSESTQAAGW
jgi:hypothetical protein